MLKPEFISSLPMAIADVADALVGEPSPVSILANKTKGYTPAADAQPVPWSDAGVYLPDRPSFTLDPALHQGRYYVQDASSMVVASIVGRLFRFDPTLAEAPGRYLDACAAPGGKTIGALTALPADWMVVANEYIGRRASILAENVAKWGSPRVVVTSDDTARLGRLTHFFDIIAADVPCSGEGMMRKDEEAAQQWSPALVKQCADRQREIVDNLWEALRPGGYFIYSTCTFNRAENEEIVDHLVRDLGGESIDTGLAGSHGIAPGIDTPHHCLRMLPGRVRGEGLFAAVVRKPEAPAQRKPLKAAPKPVRIKEIEPWLNGDMLLSQHSDTIVAIPADIAPIAAAVRQAAKVVCAGVKVATVKGRDYIPAQELVLSSAFCRGSIAEVEVDRDTALQYLRRQAVVLPDGSPRGTVLLTFDGYPLGIAKNLGSRANNLYPQAWRILK